MAFVSEIAPISQSTTPITIRTMAVYMAAFALKPNAVIASAVSGRDI
jgi:hypothetical protein